MLAASKELHNLYGVDYSKVLSVAVSGDDTWMKRGHVSRYGIYTLISLDSGKVLKVVSLSKHCPSCTFNHNKNLDRNNMDTCRNADYEKVKK